MKTELDDYLLKCILEELESGGNQGNVEELCSCRLGFSEPQEQLTTEQEY